MEDGNKVCLPSRLPAVSSDLTLNTYRTAVSPTLDLLCHEDFNVGRSEAKISGHQSPNSSMEIDLCFALLALTGKAYGFQVFNIQRQSTFTRQINVGKLT